MLSRGQFQICHHLPWHLEEGLYQSTGLKGHLESKVDKDFLSVLRFLPLFFFHNSEQRKQSVIIRGEFIMKLLKNQCSFLEKRPFQSCVTNFTFVILYS